MPKPLRSQTDQPKDVQFAHFGVLDSGSQGKGSLFSAIIINVLLALIAVIIGAATVKTVDNRKKEAIFVTPLKEKPPEPIKKPPPPKLIPPKIIPPRAVETPKIKLPDVKIIEPPKPVEVKIPKPLPVVTPAPPRNVVAAAAPKPVAVNLGKSASVVNNDPHPTAVALGHADNPIHPSNLPATASVNLGQRGLAGMPSTNTGGGPPAKSVNLGSGQPNGSIGGTGARAVQGVSLGVKNGVPGGTGNGIGNQPQQVALGRTPPPPAAAAAAATSAPRISAPQVTYKPKPVYSAEATSAHIEGRVAVKIHVAPNGTVTSAIVVSGLGHGLDESAVRAAQATRFKPATDASGNPVDWDGVVSITFQLAG